MNAWERASMAGYTPLGSSRSSASARERRENTSSQRAASIRRSMAVMLPIRSAISAAIACARSIVHSGLPPRRSMMRMMCACASASPRSIAQVSACSQKTSSRGTRAQIDPRAARLRIRRKCAASRAASANASHNAIRSASGRCSSSAMVRLCASSNSAVMRSISARF